MQIRIHKRFCCTSSPLNIVFFGTDEFACSSLKKLLNAKRSVPSKINQLVVCTPPDKIRGKSFTKESVPVKKLALLEKLQSMDAPISFGSHGWKEHVLTCADKPKYDLGVVVSFGYFLPPLLLSKFRLGMINLHPSLLPKYRGASPIEAALMHNDSETGVSIIAVHPQKMDAGAILAQKKVALPLEETLPVTHERLALLGAELLVETVLDIHSKLHLAVPQDESRASVCAKLAKENGRLQWDSMDALGIWGIFRAASSARLKPHTFFNNLKTVILDMLPPSAAIHATVKQLLPLNATPGTLFYSKKTPEYLYVRTGHQSSDSYLAWVIVKKLQIDKKAKPLLIKDFANGYKILSSQTKFI